MTDDNKHHLNEGLGVIGFASDEIEYLEGKAARCAQKDKAIVKLNEAYAALQEVEKFMNEPEPNEPQSDEDDEDFEIAEVERMNTD